MSGLRWTPQMLADHRAKAAKPAHVQPAHPMSSAKTTFKSKAEERFAAQLEAQKKSGEITDWRYEPIRLRLLDHETAWYTPDFMTLHPDGTVTLIEIKGFMREAARLRFMMARQKFPHYRWRLVWAKRHSFEEGWI